MNLNEYQDAAMETRMPSCNNFGYMMLNLVAEAGETAGKIAKAIRKNEVEITSNRLRLQDQEVLDRIKDEIALELGDVLWQTAGLAKVFNLSLEEIAVKNLEKLKDRQKRNVIVGDGDYR